MKKIAILKFIILIILTSCINKSSFNKKVIGKWCVVDNRHSEIKRIIPLEGKLVIFSSDSMGLYNLDGGFVSVDKYNIVDSIIESPNYFGKMEELYKIKLLTVDTLILEVMNDKIILLKCE